MGRQVTARWAPTIGTTLEGKSDANWQVARSTSGFVFEKTHAAISWGMKKQQSIALSTFEAETMAASLACCEAVWLRNLFEELGFPPAGPTVLYLDNSAAIDLAHDREAINAYIERLLDEAERCGFGSSAVFAIRLAIEEAITRYRGG